MTDQQTAQDRRRETLRADCGNCAGLCCVALAFGRASGFGFDKEAGDPCRNLQQDFGCGIHPVLRERGFSGCTVFDCGGAGQKVSQVTFSGRTWRDEPSTSELMFVTLQVMRPLQDLLKYLDDALSRPAAEELSTELLAAYERLDGLTRQSADDVLAIDLKAERVLVEDLLTRSSELVRAAARDGRPPSRAGRRCQPGADLAGASLAGEDLRGAALRGAHLIAADLSGSDLTGADVLSTDMRDADLSGADLSQALYLTQFQVSSAKGDARTQLPTALSRPAHWTGADQPV